jgi:hypothetical protein
MLTARRFVKLDLTLQYWIPLLHRQYLLSNKYKNYVGFINSYCPTLHQHHDRIHTSLSTMTDNLKIKD